MAVPTILSTSPSTGESSVYKNKVLSVTFSEALLSSTVNAGTFLLKNLDTNEIVPVDVSLSSAVVSITPVRHLVAQTSYRLTIVGADTAVGTPVQSSTSDSLANTTFVTFSTGDDIEVTAAQKTEAEKELEGEIDLPTNWSISSTTSELTILASSPTNRDFGVDASLDEVVVVFSGALNTSTVTDSTFQVVVDPYYEEDDLYLAYPDTSDGSANFKWEAPTDTSNVPLDFSDLSGTLTASNDTVTWTADPDRDFPRNTKITVTMTTGIQSASGTALNGNYQIAFYIDPFPFVISVDRVRDEFFPHCLSNWTDDMIGKAIYKNTLDALNCMRWDFDFRNRNRVLSQYVLYATVVDIFEGLQIERDLLAGQFKKLGDMAIRYDVNAVKALPAKMVEAMKKAKKAKDALCGRWTKTARSVVKGRLHPEQKTVWRTRAWRQEIAHALENYYYGEEVAANTRSHRATKVPGGLDIWA